MDHFRKILPSTVYGLAWYVSTNHEILGFITLLIGGFLVGFILHFKNYFLQILLATFLTGLLGGIAATGIGAILVAIVLLYFLYKQIKVILENLPLFIVGFGLYFALLKWPAELHTALFGSADQGVGGWGDFFIGTGIMFLVTLILGACGYKRRRVFTFTIGMPAFLFMFKYARDHSPLHELSGDL